MTEIIIAFSSIILTAIVTWVFSRRKTDAEIKKTLSEADSITVSTVIAGIKELREENNSLKTEIKQLSDEIKDFKLALLHIDNCAHRSSCPVYRFMYNEQKTESNQNG